MDPRTQAGHQLLETLQRGADAAREALTDARRVHGHATDALGAVYEIRPGVPTADVVGIATAMQAADEAAVALEAALKALQAMGARYAELLRD